MKEKCKNDPLSLNKCQFVQALSPKNNFELEQDFPSSAERKENA